MEENTHAMLLETFKDMIKDGRFDLSSRRFSFTIIEKNMEKLSSLQNHAMRSGISIKEAVESAMEVERGILEHKVFLSYDGDPPEVKRILNTLSEDTRRHSKEVKELYNKLRD